MISFNLDTSLIATSLNVVTLGIRNGNFKVNLFAVDFDQKLRPATTQPLPVLWHAASARAI